jgi:hypothetical protein
VIAGYSHGQWASFREDGATVPDATRTQLRLALAFIEQVRDGAYGDLGGIDAQQALDEIAELDL